MAETLNPPAMFHRLKREQPFKPFEVVTKTGERHSVNGRFHFAYNIDYVALLDHKNIPIHVNHTDIVAINVGTDQAGGR